MKPRFFLRFLSFVAVVFIAANSSLAQYFETFSTPNKGYLVNFVDDFSGVNWILSTWPQVPGAPFGRGTSDYFQTTGAGVLEAINLDVEVCWTSPALTATATGTSAFSADISWTGFDVGQVGPDEYINVEYNLNGVGWVRHPNIIGANGDPAFTVRYIGGPTPASGSATTNFPAIPITSGNMMLVRVCSTNNSNAEITALDNVRVTNFASGPTAAVVGVGGRVLTMGSRGISRAVITLTAPDGSIRSAVTNSFGYYRFSDIAVGETYILNAAGKGYTFVNPTRVITLKDELTAEDFIANPQ